MAKVAIWMLVVVMTAARYDWVIATILGCGVLLCMPIAPRVVVNVPGTKDG